MRACLPHARFLYFLSAFARAHAERPTALPLSVPSSDAADGYARAKGVGCCVVTFTVGGLSAINAVAGPRAAEGTPRVLL